MAVVCGSSQPDPEGRSPCLRLWENSVEDLWEHVAARRQTQGQIYFLPKEMRGKYANASDLVCYGMPVDIILVLLGACSRD